MFLFDRCEKRRAIDSGHVHVGDDYVDCRVFHYLQSGFTTKRKHHFHLSLVFLEGLAVRFQNFRLIIDKKGCVSRFLPALISADAGENFIYESSFCAFCVLPVLFVLLPSFVGQCS